MKTLILYLIVLLLILNHQTIIIENQKILTFFLYQLLPSLFILCFFIQLLPFPKTKSYQIPLLNINTTTFYLIIKMILLGIPTNTYLINQLVKNNQINKLQAKRLIYCINIPSISFMFMSIPYMSNIKFAFILFIIHTLSIILLLFITNKNKIYLDLTISNHNISNSLLFTIKSMVYILAYLFVMNSLKSILSIYFPSCIHLFHLTFEFSSGISNFIGSLKYCLLCIGFSGFCAHMQIINGCEYIDIDYKIYLFYRILHCIFNIILLGLFQCLNQILHFF